MKLNDKTYNVLKFTALVLLPGLGATYVALAQIWNLPNAEQVVGTTTAIDTLLGLLLRSISSNYNQGTDGNLIIATDPVDGNQYASMQVSRSSIGALQEKDLVRLQVVNKTVDSSSDAE